MRLAAGEVERFRALAERHFGLAFDDGKLTLLGEVLEDRAESAGCRTATEYLDRCLAGDGMAEEPERIAQRLTVGESYFFRNGAQFRALSEVVVPARLRARGGARKLRLLSAGCASGEEPYSMAMCLRESVSGLAEWDLDIAGVDINPTALEKAASGQYSVWSLREVPDPLRERYFVPLEKQSFCIDPTIRRMVRFARCNLNHPDPGCWRPGELDVVFCRNVIMYFSPRAAQLLVARLAQALAPGGFLFLGTAETLRGLSQAFHLRHSHGTFYYQLREAELGERATELPDGMTSPQTGRQSPSASSSRGIGVPGVPNASWMVLVDQARQRIEELARDAQSRWAQPGPPGPAPTRSEASPQPWTQTVQSADYEKALELLAPEPVESAAGVDVLLLQAILLVNQSRAEQAEAICREILGHDDLNAAAHYLMAICRENVGDRAGAADHDQYALYLDPSFAMPRLHLGLMARRAGEWDAARRELGVALLLLAREDASRILLLGGGFTREGLVTLCRAELRACGGDA
jgi:chemotaxis protein methyltransferase CheR